MRVFALNQSVIRLLQLANAELASIPQNRYLFVDQEDTHLKELLLSQEKKNCYTYELIIPAKNEEEISRIIQEDMYRYFGIQLIKDTVLRDFVEISSLDTLHIQKSKYTESKIQLDKSTNQKFMRKIPLSQVVKQLNYFSPYPLIIHTPMDIEIDIELSADFSGNIDKITDALRNAGLTTKFMHGPIEVISISRNRQ